VSHPTEDELVDLAVGDDAVTPSVAAHVDGCDTCAATVAELRHAAALVAASPSYADWQAPRHDVWAAITDELSTENRGPQDRGTTALGTSEPATGALGTEELAADQLGTDELGTDELGTERRGPDGPTTVAATSDDLPPAEPARPEPATPHTDDELGRRREGRAERDRRGRGRRLSVGWGAGLAAASLAIGLLAGRAIWQQEPPARPVAQVPLATLDTKQDEGEATVVRSGQGLDLTVATTTPLDAGDGYLEVWLLNSDGKRMVSVGVLGPGDDTESFPISQALIDEGYVVVDISREKFDDSPAHSGDSLLRGTLPA